MQRISMTQQYRCHGDMTSTGDARMAGVPVHEAKNIQNSEFVWRLKIRLDLHQTDSEDLLRRFLKQKVRRTIMFVLC